MNYNIDQMLNSNSTDPRRGGSSDLKITNIMLTTDSIMASVGSPMVYMDIARGFEGIDNFYRDMVHPVICELLNSSAFNLRKYVRDQNVFEHIQDSLDSKAMLCGVRGSDNINNAIMVGSKMVYMILPDIASLLNNVDLSIPVGDLAPSGISLVDRVATTLYPDKDDPSVINISLEYAFVFG